MNNKKKINYNKTLPIKIKKELNLLMKKKIIQKLLIPIYKKLKIFFQKKISKYLIIQKFLLNQNYFFIIKKLNKMRQCYWFSLQ